MDNHRILQTGDLIQWYRIEKLLGRGGFGVTYLATDTNLDHKVAIKEYMPGWAVERLEDNSLVPLDDKVREDFDLGVQSFLREARTLVKFRHPNIVRVMTVFEANNTAYLVMEYEEGEEFKSYVQRGDGIDEDSLRSLILRIVDGLDQVHKYGFLHRDIKPVNLIVRNDGTPVLLDFGAARSTDVDAGAHTAYVSAGYTPIEQYQEGEGMKVGPWTDIYALGATLYYAISGETPIGPTGRLAAMVTRSPDPMKSALEVGHGRYSNSFLDAIDWALSFQPDLRPQDLSEWRRALGEEKTAAAEHQPIETLQPQLLKPTEQEAIRPEGTQRDSQRNARGQALGQSNGHSHARNTGSKEPGFGRTVALLGSLVAMIAVGGWFYQNYQSRSAVDELLSRADTEFANGAYIDGAAPLYRQILGSASDNNKAQSIAQSRLAEIEEITKDQIDTAIKNGDIDLAEKSLAEFQSFSTDTGLLESLEEKIDTARQRRTVDAQFEQVLAFVSDKEHQQALDMLEVLRKTTPDDSRIVEIENAINTAKEEEQQAIDQAREEAESDARIDAEKKRKEAELQQRVAEANRRQRQRRQTYDRYLSQAQSAISEGDIVAARSSLDSARSLQISESRLTALEAQVVEQETYLRKPLTEYEVSYASGQFNALRGAVESKNVRAIESLSEGTPNRQGLFDTLFGRYTRLDVDIIEVKPELDPKRVTAKLRIAAMILPNGDIVYPSPTYRDTELTLNRQRYGWSRIIW